MRLCSAGRLACTNRNVAGLASANPGEWQPLKWEDCAGAARFRGRRASFASGPAPCGCRRGRQVSPRVCHCHAAWEEGGCGKAHSAPSRHSFSCGLPRRHRARFAHGAIGSRNPPAQCRGEGSALRAASSVGSKSTGSGRSPARARTRRAATFAPLELPSAMRTRSCSSATS